MREINNDRRFVGAWVVDGRGRSGRRWRRKALGALERRTKREWSALYGRQERQREQLARTDGRSLHYDNPPVDWYTLTRWVWEERMEQVREIDGEQAYEKMRRAVERASQPLAPSQFPSRDEPERGGPERDYGPSR